MKRAIPKRQGIMQVPQDPDRGWDDNEDEEEEEGGESVWVGWLTRRAQWDNHGAIVPGAEPQ